MTNRLAVSWIADEIVSRRIKGIEYTPEAADSLRDELIVMRDGALAQHAFEWAVALSHVIAMMAEYKEILESVPTRER